MDRCSLPPTIRWVGGTDGHVELLDQTRLPTEEVMLAAHDVETVWEAIRSLRVRGAPAIGVAAAMAVVLGVRQRRPSDSRSALVALRETCDYLRTARPTAVNLFWAVDRVARRGEAAADRPVDEMFDGLLEEAQAIAREDEAMCRAIGETGQTLIAEGSGVLTHCNAGALATAGSGTALAVIYAAHARGRRFRVFADETRPLLQGARLTAWELSRAGVDVTVLCDNAAGELMKSGQVGMVITGADRIAANGDAANKIGTYGVATLARAHGIPFYVAAPRSTFDLALADGREIAIEHRSEVEVREGFGSKTVPDGVACYNPAFDVTPAELIDGIVTDCGLIRPVTADNVRKIFSS